MTEVGPFRPYHTAAEVVVRIGPMAEISTSVADGLPILEVAWGSVTVLLMPNSVAEGRPIAACDVERAKDLHRASGVFLDAVGDLWARQRLAAAKPSAVSMAPAPRRAAAGERRRSEGAASAACVDESILGRSGTHGE